MENNQQQTNPATTSINIDDKTMGIIAHVGGLLTSFVIPLVIWLIQKDKEGSAKDHALEALNFQITIFIGWMVAMVTTFVFIGFLMYPVLLIANIYFSIMAAMAASNNQKYSYPYTLRLIK